MSDTNSKGGGKRDTEKIQIFKIGENDRVSKVPDEELVQRTNHDRRGPSPELPSEESSIQLAEPIVIDENDSEPLPLDENEALFSSEMQIERNEPELENRLGELKSQIEALSKKSKKEILSSDQVELLKRYISLKETEVRDIKDQQKQYRAFVKKLSKHIDSLTAENHELLLKFEATKDREIELKDKLETLKDKHENEMSLLKNDSEERSRNLGNVKSESHQLEQRQHEWKEKIREDLKRIKLKERELENKYELLKRDTQALLDSKDSHVLELKKKNDALEMELETFEERLRSFNTIMSSIDSKKRRLTDTLRLVLSLLEEIDVEQGRSDPGDRKAG